MIGALSNFVHGERTPIPSDTDESPRTETSQYFTPRSDLDIESPREPDPPPSQLLPLPLPPPLIFASPRASRLKRLQGARKLRLTLSETDDSFGLLLSHGMRVAAVDDGTPAARGGLQPLDLVVAVDHKRCSANTIGEQIAGKVAIELTIERPADDTMCRLASDEQVHEWTLWRSEERL